METGCNRQHAMRTEIFILASKKTKTKTHLAASLPLARRIHRGRGARPSPACGRCRRRRRRRRLGLGDLVLSDWRRAENACHILGKQLARGEQLGEAAIERRIGEQRTAHARVEEAVVLGDDLGGRAAGERGREESRSQREGASEKRGKEGRKI